MERTLAKDTPKQVGKTVRLSGWLMSRRDHGKLIFCDLRDATGTIQLVLTGKTAIDYSIPIESVITVLGKVRERPKGMVNLELATGTVEVAVRSIEVLSRAEPLPFEIDKTDTVNEELRLDYRYLGLRQPSSRLIFEIQTTVEYAMRDFWQSEQFIEIHSPKLMRSASESGGELFQVDYFDGKAYLAQSPQFYKQMAMAAGFDRVFEIGPVFRANPSFTSRHDTEFTSVDVEIAWIESHEEVMALEERWLHHVLKKISKQYGKIIQTTFGAEVVVPKIPFPRLTLADAHQILKKIGHGVSGGKGDLDPEGERLLAEYVKEEHNHEFVFVTDYPIRVRPFYHMRYGKPEVTKSFDLIWKGLEITTGAQREHRYEPLVAQAQEKGIGLESIQHYLDFFKFGCPPHGGFGFGLSRMLMILLNRKNVREVTYLYRGPHRLSP